MPTKKKSRGGCKAARKAANGAKKAEEDDKHVPDISNSQSRADDDDLLLEEAIKLAAAEKKAMDEARCFHGFQPSEVDFEDVTDFCIKFTTGFSANPIANMNQAFISASNATQLKYDKMWDDAEKIESVVCCFLAFATKDVLTGKLRSACNYASYAAFFEEHHLLYHLTLLKNAAIRTTSDCFNSFNSLNRLYAAAKHVWSVANQVVNGFQRTFSCCKSNHSGQ